MAGNAAPCVRGPRGRQRHAANVAVVSATLATTSTPAPDRERWRPAIPDLLVVAAAVVYAVAMYRWGRWLMDERGYNLFVDFPPLLASWAPRVGPGTVPAIVVAVLVVVSGPALAARLRWRALLAVTWAASFAWITSLALVDGWADGIAGRLASDQEYLWDIPKVDGIGSMLAVYADHVLPEGLQPGQEWWWSTHVAAHPPGAFALFIGLDRIGLAGGGWAGMVVIAVAASAAAATAVALRALGAQGWARAALPFAVLLPGAVWTGVSADGLFAAVLAWGVALAALAATAVTTARLWAWGVAAGAVLVFSLYLNYGLALAVGLALVVLGLTRRWIAVVPALAGGAAVVTAFTMAGFWWPEGFRLLRIVYAHSIAIDRPLWYFAFANLAAVSYVLGPAVLAGLRRFAVAPRSAPAAPVLLVAAAVAAMLVATVSGMSKGEVERIWLPFAVWVVLAAAALPRVQARFWLGAQAVLALAVNHLLTMPW